MVHSQIEGTKQLVLARQLVNNCSTIPVSFRLTTWVGYLTTRASFENRLTALQRFGSLFNARSV